MLKVKLKPVVFDHEELESPSLDDNLFYSHAFEVVEKLKDKLDLSVKALTSCYDLDFPTEVTINVNFVSPNQKDELCSYFGFDEDKTLGFYAVSTGDGFLDEKYHVDSFEVFIFCPSNEEYYKIINEDNYSISGIECSLFSCLATVTHEIKHALVFIESSGGLTPHQIDIAYISDEFDNDISDCVSGCNLERLEDYFYTDGYANKDKSYNQINEEIVEEEGRELLGSIKIDLERMVEDVFEKHEKELKSIPVKRILKMS